MALADIPHSDQHPTVGQAARDEVNGQTPLVSDAPVAFELEAAALAELGDGEAEPLGLPHDLRQFSPVQFALAKTRKFSSTRIRVDDVILMESLALFHWVVPGGGALGLN